jgi:release factor glutamine methyltransferase
LLNEARTKLTSAGVVHAAIEAEWLIESASGLAREDIISADPDLDAAAEARLRALVERRSMGEPLQYVTGVAGFRHLELMVGPGVFIPRPETELVAELAMSHLPSDGVLVDAGTGSGAIALSIAKERVDARVWATELSEDALGWATKNRDALGLDVELVKSDLLDELPAELAGHVDVIVGNMPYVPLEEAEFLPVDVVQHEPEVALFGSTDGLAVIERLAHQSLRWLRPGGWLVLEIGDRQGARVQAMLGRLHYEQVAMHRDLAGRERIVDGSSPASL